MQLINKHYGVKITEEEIPLDDKATWDLLDRGDTLGVFQFASNLAIPIIKKISPKNIEELAAANSLIRPGTSGLDEYCIAKKDHSKIKLYGDERLDRHLSKTFGSIVFQEQIMFLISELMGITFGQADLYRRALEKPHKDKKGYVKNFNDNVVEIAKKKGFDPEITEKVRKDIIDNSGYAFNKSHAVAYSIISYWTAWVKTNYPLVFFCNMLNDEDQFSNFLTGAEKFGITVKPPDVNKSDQSCTIEDKEKKIIRVGLNMIKGVGPAAIDSIITHKPFNSIDEFFELNNLRAVNKKVITALINIGALSNIGIRIENEDIPEEYIDNVKIRNKGGSQYLILNRNQLFKWYEKYIEITTTKTINRYAVPINMIKGKFINKYSLIIEKDECVIVPEDKLEQMELKLEDVEIFKNNRRKVSSFIESKNNISNKKVSNFRKPIINHCTDIISLKEDEVETYIKEIKELGFSFMPHPLIKNSKNIRKFEDINDGDELITGGIVMELVERTTKTNKRFYWLNIKTPHEILRITLWDNQYIKYREQIKHYGLIKVKGVKGYGGISCIKLMAI